MKKTLILLMFVVTYGCNTETPPSCLPYLMWPKEDAEKFRIYQSKGDSARSSILATQKASYLKDSVAVLEYLFLSEDTVPINKSEEKWFPDNSMELVSNSFYEFDENLGFLEVKAIVLGESKWDLKDDFVFSFEYHFKADTNQSITTHSTYQISKADIDSLFDKPTSCLIINSTNNSELTYTDERTDTSIASATIRIYKLNKGLVYFAQSNSKETKAFQLIENQ